MRIGVTGGAGFIGGHVVERALRRDHDIVVFDRRGRFPEDFSYKPDQRVDRFLGDVTDATAMSELGKHVDGIIHLAACLGTQETIRNPKPAFMTNIFGGLNFLDACAESDIPGTYIGVGNWWMDNSYSISKTAVERAVRMFNAYNGTRVNIVRAVNAYGPRQSVAPPFGPAKVRKITPAFVCRALLGEPIEIYGDGNQVSDMVHVRDVADALISSLEYADKGPLTTPVEVGPSEHLSVNQVADLVREAVEDMGGPAQPPVRHVPMRPGETPGDRVTADNTTLRYIGLDPEKLISFEGGIRETVAWFAEHWLPGYQLERRMIMENAPTVPSVKVS